MLDLVFVYGDFGSWSLGYRGFALLLCWGNTGLARAWFFQPPFGFWNRLQHKMFLSGASPLALSHCAGYLNWISVRWRLPKRACGAWGKSGRKLDKMWLLPIGVLLPTVEICQEAPLGGVNASMGTLLPVGTCQRHSNSTAAFSSILWLGVSLLLFLFLSWLLWLQPLCQSPLCLYPSLLRAQPWPDPRPFGLGRSCQKH